MSTAVAPAYKATIIASSGEYFEMGKFFSLQFGYSLNRGTQAMLVLSMEDVKLSAETKAIRQSWLRVERRDDPSDASSPYRLVWYGNLYSAKASGGPDTAQMTLMYEDLASLLGSRYTAKGYQVLVATDQSDILWEAIDDTQSETYGDLGIVRGSYPVSHNRTAAKDLQSRSILDVLTSYSEINYGIDWEITPTPYSSDIGIFNTFYKGDSYQYHKGEALTTILRYKVGTHGTLYNNNVVAYEITEDGEKFANRVAVYGAATTATQLTGTSEDVVSQSNYKLFEKHVSEPDVSVQSTLEDKSALYLNDFVQIPKDIKFTMMPLLGPRFGTFDVGDIFNVDFQHGTALAFIGQYRLYKFTVTVDNSGVEKMNFELNVV